MESVLQKSSGRNASFGSLGHSFTRRIGETGNSYGVESPVNLLAKIPRVRGLPSGPSANLFYFILFYFFKERKQRRSTKRGAQTILIMDSLEQSGKNAKFAVMLWYIYATNVTYEVPSPSFLVPYQHTEDYPCQQLNSFRGLKPSPQK